MELDDKGMRTGLKAWLADLHAGESNTVIADEVALAQHRARADLVVINGSLHGFEIKSPKDTLNRLEEQAYWYSAVFDRVSLVSAPMHVDAAAKLIPSWWEIIICDDTASTFSVWRSGQSNPDQNPHDLARLLWADEAAALLEAHGLMKGLRGKARYILHERIAESIPLDDLRAHVVMSLKARPEWRAGSPQT
jgi:hypothetical protein